MEKIRGRNKSNDEERIKLDKKGKNAKKTRKKLAEQCKK